MPQSGGKRKGGGFLCALCGRKPQVQDDPPEPKPEQAPLIEPGTRARGDVEQGGLSGLDPPAAAASSKRPAASRDPSRSDIYQSPARSTSRESSELAGSPAPATSTPRMTTEEFVIVLSREDVSAGLGVDIVPIGEEPNQMLQIVRLKGSGLFLDWNSANPDKEIKPGDNIVEVNGVRGNASSMIAECKQGRMQMVLQRQVKAEKKEQESSAELGSPQPASVKDQGSPDFSAKGSAGGNRGRAQSSSSAAPSHVTPRELTSPIREQSRTSLQGGEQEAAGAASPDSVEKQDDEDEPASKPAASARELAVDTRPEPSYPSDTSKARNPRHWQPGGGGADVESMWQRVEEQLERLPLPLPPAALKHKPKVILGGALFVVVLAVLLSVALRGGAAIEDAVDMSMVVNGIDFDKLVADGALYSEFTKEVKLAITATTGISDENMAVSFARGSVVMKAKLQTPQELEHEEFAARLGSTDIGMSVASAVKSVDNIESAAVGPISVSDVELASAGVEPLSNGVHPVTSAPTMSPGTTPERHHTSTTTPGPSAAPAAAPPGSGPQTPPPSPPPAAELPLVTETVISQTTLTTAKTITSVTATTTTIPDFRSHMRDMLDLPRDELSESQIQSLETAKLKRCALIGASPLLKGKGHGVDIDSFDIVIRVNRVPTPKYYEDFGTRTDILYSNSMSMYKGLVTLMGHGDDVKTIDCRPPHCDYLGMMFRGDYGCDFDKLKATWGTDTSYVLGCTARNVTKIAYSFKLLQTVEPTSGFMAFLTFAPLCHEFILYGFAGSGAIDGHTEWEGHSLFYEHQILNSIADGVIDKIEFAEAQDWLKQHLPNVLGGVKVQVIQN